MNVLSKQLLNSHELLAWATCGLLFKRPFRKGYSMSIKIKKIPGAAATASEEIPNKLYQLYNSTEIKAQAVVQRRYRVSTEHARVIAGILCAGGQK